MISSLGVADDVSRAAVVRADDDRLDDEDGHRARGGAVADRPARHPQRRRRGPARCPKDDARLRRRPRFRSWRPYPCCTRPGCSRSACCSCSSSRSATFIAPYFSAQRLVLPELVGEDPADADAGERGRRNRIAPDDPPRPRFAGLLIASIGAANVLYVDAATFAVSFLLLLLFVPNRPPLPRKTAARGVLAGLRFMFQD